MSTLIFLFIGVNRSMTTAPRELLDFQLRRAIRIYQVHDKAFEYFPCYMLPYALSFTAKYKESIKIVESSN